MHKQEEGQRPQREDRKNNRNRGERKSKRDSISLSQKSCSSKSKLNGKKRSLKHKINKRSKKCTPCSLKSDKNKQRNNKAPCGKIKIFFGKLGETYNRPVDITNNQGNDTRPNKYSKVKSLSKRHKHAKRTERTCRPGDNRTFEKGSNLPCKRRDRPIREHNLSKGKKKREAKTNNKSKESKLLHCVRKIQNGGVKTNDRDVKKGRFNGEVGHERCLLQPSNPLRLSEICEVYLERLPVRVCLSLLRTCTRPKNIYKNFESPCSVSTQAEHPASNLLRRHTGHGGKPRNHTPGQGYDHLPPSKLGVCNKSGDISDGTYSGNRIFGNVNKFRKKDLPGEKIENILGLCQKVLQSKEITLRELSKLIGKLTSTYAAVLPAPLNCKFLQMNLIKGLKNQLSYETTVKLDRQGKLELDWWIENLKLQNGRKINLGPPDLIIQSDAAKTGGWGAHCQGKKTGGQWNQWENQQHINIQETIAAELAIRTFTKLKKPKRLHLQIDNTVALSCILKMGSTKNEILT